MPRSVIAGGVGVRVTAEDREFRAAMRRTNAELRKQRRQLAEQRRAYRAVDRQIQGLIRRFTSFRAVIGVAAGGGIFGAAVKQAAALGAELVEVSRGLGDTVENSQRLRQAFASDGIAAEAVIKAFENIRRAAIRAADGEKQYLDALRSFGISDFRQFANLGSIEQALALNRGGARLSQAQIIANLRDIGIRDASRFAGVFGQPGRVASNLAGIENLTRVSDEAATNLKALDQEMLNLRETIQGTFANAVGDSADELKDIIASVGQFFRQNADTIAVASATFAENLKEIGRALLISFGIGVGARAAQGGIRAFQALKTIIAGAAAGTVAAPGAGTVIGALAGLAIAALTAKTALDAVGDAEGQRTRIDALRQFRDANQFTRDAATAARVEVARELGVFLARVEDRTPGLLGFDSPQEFRARLQSLGFASVAEVEAEFERLRIELAVLSDLGRSDSLAQFNQSIRAVNESAGQAAGSVGRLITTVPRSTLDLGGFARLPVSQTEGPLGRLGRRLYGPEGVIEGLSPVSPGIDETRRTLGRLTGPLIQYRDAVRESAEETERRTLDELLLRDSIRQLQFSSHDLISSFVDGSRSVREAVADFVASLGRTIFDRASQTFFDRLLDRFFHEGGAVSPGVAVVGEQGPELVDFRTSGRVYSNATLQNLGRGGGGVVFAPTVYAVDPSGVRLAMENIYPEFRRRLAADIASDIGENAAYRNIARIGSR